tara:strand:+ start:943 stop:1830 length:888 start_codon:yes stop_codon:yes gene_type:complete
MLAEVKVKDFLQRAVRGETELSPTVLEEFTQDCREALKKQFTARDPEWRIRMSGLGRPLCQQVQGREGHVEEMTYNAILRFLIGDLVEAVMMAVLKESGVTIVDSQKNCEIKLGEENVKGTLDVILDDPVDGEKVWDIKSASPFSYSQKFSKGYDNLKEDDPFGYVMQGILYSTAVGKKFGGWLVVDKSSGEIQFVQAPEDQEEDRKKYLAEAVDRVDKLNSGFSFAKPPMKPEEETYKASKVIHKTGNKLLHKSCTFCGYREVCWPKAVKHEKITSKARIKPLVWYHTLKVKEL